MQKHTDEREVKPWLPLPQAPAASHCWDSCIRCWSLRDEHQVLPLETRIQVWPCGMCVPQAMPTPQAPAGVPHCYALSHRCPLCHTAVTVTLLSPVSHCCPLSRCCPLCHTAVPGLHGAHWRVAAAMLLKAVTPRSVLTGLWHSKGGQTGQQICHRARTPTWGVGLDPPGVCKEI